MDKKIEDIKLNIILIISIMMVLFIICLVLYSDTFKKFININLETNYTLSGGQDELSQSLEKLIPYTDSSSPKYLTAYQGGKTNINNIHNDVLLFKSIESLDFTNLTTSNVQNALLKLYGQNYFITHNTFSINGVDMCLFDKEYNTYTCNKQNISIPLYKAYRKIAKIDINGEDTSLTENIIFYSEEVIDDTTIYKIYTDGTYQIITKAFTNHDLEEKNTTIELYLDTLSNFYTTYVSSFKKNNDNYNWIGTVKQ